MQSTKNPGGTGLREGTEIFKNSPRVSQVHTGTAQAWYAKVERGGEEKKWPAYKASWRRAL